MRSKKEQANLNKNPLDITHKIDNVPTPISHTVSRLHIIKNKKKYPQALSEKQVEQLLEMNNYIMVPD